MHENLTLFVGRLHPLLVHLPIGFLFALAGLELAARVGRFRDVAAARGVVLGATVLAALMSVAAGLMLSTAGGYDPHLLAWHKWTGLTLAAFVIATAAAYAARRRRAYAGLLIATLALLGPASHFGGSMTHGPDYLTAYGPAWLRSAPRSTTRPVVRTVAVADPMRAHLYADVVRPILAADCVSCHGPERSSGLLRLDSPDAIRAGGSTGPGVVAGNPDASLVVQRMLLPTSNSHHMPPAEGPQPGDDAVAAVRWWVAAGATDAVTADAHPTAEQTALLDRLLGVAPKPAPAVVTAKPLDQLSAEIAAADKAGIACEPIAAGQPWLYCNATRHRPFADADLAVLAGIAGNVRSLNLAGTAVTDAGMAAVAALPNLAELHLERTRVTDAGLRRLAPLANLEYLNLYGTPVTAAGLDALKPLPALRRVYVWQTKVTPAAAAAFAAEKVDPLKARALERQIAELQEQIRRQHVDVIGGATTAPSTRPAEAVTDGGPRPGAG